MHISSHNAATGFVRVTPPTLLCSGRWCPSRQLKRVIDTPPHIRADGESHGDRLVLVPSAASAPPRTPVLLYLMTGGCHLFPAVTPPRPDVSESPSVVSPQLSESDGPTNALSRSGLKRPQWLCALAERVRQPKTSPIYEPCLRRASNGVPARAFAPPTRSTKSNTPTSRSSRTNDTTSTPAHL